MGWHVTNLGAVEMKLQIVPQDCLILHRKRKPPRWQHRLLQAWKWDEAAGVTGKGVTDPIAWQLEWRMVSHGMTACWSGKGETAAVGAWGAVAFACCREEK